MDHGPILDQIHMPIANENWPLPGPELDLALAKMGGTLLADTITAWVNDEIVPQDQDHEAATYCGRFSKAEQELNLDPQNLPDGETAKQMWHKVNAFAGIGDTFFIHDGKRVKIKQAELADKGALNILRVIPEGKKEIDFADFLRSLD
jgi:methionyl-tRNA formyltransferase